ncbi:hypothetical protein EVAR_97422_1 [Eumeta japonica]|uniref:Uncharacterized protein n=1 Tax=Eumeta variegata TaxID=151549 RepID=A0A4C1WXA7_EUMVA|nr:hypothetical protein EVAR_97422_1 [Eumeta japonica]
MKGKRAIRSRWSPPYIDIYRSRGYSRKVTAEVVTLRLYPVTEWYFTSRVDPYSYCSQVDRSMALPRWKFSFEIRMVIEYKIALGGDRERGRR